jgi:ribosomal protein L37AE/L43A
MSSKTEMIKWSPRVSQQKIRLLYEKDAEGIIDEELIDDVSFSFFVRCQDIITVTDASQGKVKCVKCETLIFHKWNKEEILKCKNCSWEITWGAYFKSYQKKQLHGGGAFDVFKRFVDKLPKAHTPEEKMILVDQLIHEAHHWRDAKSKEPVFTRPAAVNIIKGKLKEVMLFLDQLSRGPKRKNSHNVCKTKLLTWDNYVKEREKKKIMSLNRFEA